MAATFLVRTILQIDHRVARRRHRADLLVEFELHRCRVAILRILNQKNHQKRHHTGSRVNHQLPRVRVMKHGAGDSPGQHNENGNSECSRRPDPVGNPACIVTKALSTVDSPALPFACGLPLWPSQAAPRRDDDPRLPVSADYGWSES